MHHNWVSNVKKPDHILSETPCPRTKLSSDKSACIIFRSHVRSFPTFLNWNKWINKQTVNAKHKVSGMVNLLVSWYSTMYVLLQLFNIAKERYVTVWLRLKKGLDSIHCCRKFRFFGQSLISLEPSCGNKAGRGRTRSFAYEESSISFRAIFWLPLSG
jgi:hypothetical protein